MKKVLVLLIIGVPFFAKGQKIGINIGLGVSTLYKVGKYENSLPEYKYRLSYSFDLNWWAKISNKVAINPGIGMARRTTKFEHPLDLVRPVPKIEAEFLYLLFPLRFQFLLNDNVIPFVGPQLGYRISEKFKNGEYYTFLEDKKFDYGVELGIGMKVAPQAMVGVRFYNGFGNVERIGHHKGHTMSKNRSIELTCNYRILNRK
jgi:hypothetical protein